MKKIIFFICSVIFLASCEKDDICSQDSPQTPYALMEFAVKVGGINQKITLSDFKVYGIKNGLIGPQINSVTSGNSVLLPLDFSTDKTEFLFDASGIQGIVSVSYKAELQFVSKACGYRFIFTELNFDNVSAKFIESIEAGASSTLISSRQTAATIFFKQP